MKTKTSGTAAPPGYDPSQFPAFAVTVDVVILTMSEGMLHVLLVCRGEAPFKGMWAIPGGFKRPTETLDEAAKRELARGDRRRRREPADAVRRLRRSRARPADERRHGRVPRGASRRRSDRRRLGCRGRCADARVRRAQRQGRARVRPPADRARRGRARSRRARGHGHRDRVRRADVHPRRAACGVRGDLGRAARRRELPTERRRRGRLGDPDRPPGAARLGRRQARGALPSRARRGATADRSIESQRPDERK